MSHGEVPAELVRGHSHRMMDERAEVGDEAEEEEEQKEQVEEEERKSGVKKCSSLESFQEHQWRASRM